MENPSRISLATLGRMLKETRRVERLPRAYPFRLPDTAAHSAVPLRLILWDMREPGHFTVDLVHHGVPDEAGQLVCTMQCFDVPTESRGVGHGQPNAERAA